MIKAEALTTTNEKLSENIDCQKPLLEIKEFNSLLGPFSIEPVGPQRYRVLQVT